MLFTSRIGQEPGGNIRGARSRVLLAAFSFALASSLFFVPAPAQADSFAPGGSTGGMIDAVTTYQSVYGGTYGVTGTPGGQVNTYASGGSANQINWSDHRQGTSVSSSYSNPLWSPTTPLECVGPDCPGAAVFGSVDMASGTFKASSGAFESILPGSINGYAQSVDSSASAQVYDSITLSQAATVILTGQFTGSVAANKSNWSAAGGPIAFGNLSMGFSSGQLDVPGYANYGGVTIQPGGHCYGASCSQTVNQSFAVPINLPGGVRLDFNGFLVTGAQAAAIYSITGSESEYALASFADTATFGLLVPQGVTVTSGSGFFPVSTVPLPLAAWLFGSGLLGLIGIARRKRNEQEEAIRIREPHTPTGEPS